MPLHIRPYALEDREALVEQFLGLNRYEEPLARNRRTDRKGAVECLDAALGSKLNQFWLRRGAL